MHTIGKVFLVLVFLAAPVAAVFTAKLMNIRGSWMQKISQNQTRIESNEDNIAKSEAELKTLQTELTRQRLSWDVLYQSPTATVDPNTGRVTVNVGTDRGLGVRPEGLAPPIVQAFAEGPQGSIYIGPFVVSNSARTQAILDPLFTIVPGDPASWPRNTPWHLWQSAPADASSSLVERLNTVVIKREARDSRQGTLALQTKAAQEANAHLQGRMKELFGNDQAVKLEESPEVSVGLVAAIADAEKERNAELVELDELRHRVDATHRHLMELLEQNRMLVQSLPNLTQPAEVSSR